MDVRRSSSLEDIVALSDDEVLPSSSHSSVCVQASAKQGPGTQPSKKRSFRIIPSRADVRQRLLKLFSTNCRCVKARNHQSQKSSCFRAFLGDEPALQEILRLRLRLKQMHKQDADDEVTVLSSDTHPKLVESSTASWDFQYLRKIVEIAQLLESSIPWGGTLIELAERLSSSWQANYVSGGTPMCQQSFAKLLGLGSQRFRRLQKCAKLGVKAPMDGRSVKRANAHASTSKSCHRQAIVEFLQEIYISLSEPMPEAKGPVRGHQRLAFQRRRGRRPRMAAQLHRKADASEMRLLPPGTFTDYLQMLRARDDDYTKISLKLFTKESCS